MELMRMLIYHSNPVCSNAQNRDYDKPWSKHWKGANSIRAYTASGETVTSTLTVTCSVTTIRETTSAKVTIRSGQSSGSRLYATGELVSAYIVSGTPLEDSNHYYTYLWLLELLVLNSYYNVNKIV